MWPLLPPVKLGFREPVSSSFIVITWRLAPKVPVRPGPLDVPAAITIHFWVLKFECYNQADFIQSAGRDLLQMQVPGFRGSLIAASIPVKYASEVEIEFTVLDVRWGCSKLRTVLA
jgi:hypothetical protein